MFISILGADTEASVAANIARALFEAVFAVTLIVMVGRLFLRPLFRLVANARSTELFIAALLFVIVSTGFVAAVAGMSMALGAFLAGLLLAETEYRKAIEATIEPFKGLLLGLFFFSVGMGLDVRELVRYPVSLPAGAIGLIGFKTLIVVAAARFFKLSWPAALETGLLLGPGGEFAFVAVGLAAALGLVTKEAASFTFALTSLTMALIPLLAILARRLTRRFQRRVDLPPDLALAPIAPGKHAIVVGYGRVGKMVCSLLKTHGLAYTAADHDPAVVTGERREGSEVFYGDATSADFLKACGIAEAAGLIITTQTKSVTSDIVDRSAQAAARHPDRGPRPGRRARAASVFARRERCGSRDHRGEFAAFRGRADRIRRGCRTGDCIDPQGAGQNPRRVAESLYRGRIARDPRHPRQDPEPRMSPRATALYRPLVRIGSVPSIGRRKNEP